MKVTLSSVLVDDQGRARQFYTDKLGFVLKLRSRGVAFRTPPAQAGPVTVAVFDDTCGNWIQLHQV